MQNEILEPATAARNAYLAADVGNQPPPEAYSGRDPLTGVSRYRIAGDTVIVHMRIMRPERELGALLHDGDRRAPARLDCAL